MALSKVRREDIEVHIKDVPNEEKEEVAYLMSKIMTHEAYGKPYVTDIYIYFSWCASLIQHVSCEVEFNYKELTNFICTQCSFDHPRILHFYKILNLDASPHT